MEPLQPCYQEIEKFIEPETEYQKKDFIAIVAFKVSYYAITVLKLLQFHRIGKDDKGNVYLI